MKVSFVKINRPSFAIKLRRGLGKKILKLLNAEKSLMLEKTQKKENINKLGGGGANSKFFCTLDKQNCQCGT